MSFKLVRDGLTKKKKKKKKIKKRENGRGFG